VTPTSLIIMEEFLEKIKELEKSEIEASAYLSTFDERVVEIIMLADTLLIDDNGYCNWEHINFMKNSNYDVFPIERDRFGWLIGGIQTSKGIIAYG